MEIKYEIPQQDASISFPVALYQIIFSFFFRKKNKKSLIPVGFRIYRSTKLYTRPNKHFYSIMVLPHL